MEVHWFTSLDLRKTYILLLLPAQHDLIPVFTAGSGKSVLWFVIPNHPYPGVTDVAHQFLNH